ncbi:cyclin-J [Bactrocera tryoni]|uniref:cyclin-J n=1 Tax=Bactrocera tryoni TaxID=59916 RepID=UPI001A980C5E|nr:cyclin-J [Bactrocera tryoni]
MESNKSPDSCGYSNFFCHSPIIPLTNYGVDVNCPEMGTTTLDVPLFPQYSNPFELFTNQRTEISHWLCDYSDDIFQTLRETELRRIVLGFQSKQCTFREAMLRLLKVAAELHSLSRTTLHLALYLLDGFMDNFTIRSEKLNLTALTCLIIAAKIEEADINAPKFVDMNKLVGDVYTVEEFRQAEMKVLMLFHFDLIRPTVATFAEYFANHIITLDDYHLYLQNWHGGLFKYHSILNSQMEILNYTTTDIVPPFYRTYKEMATALSKLMFTLVDESLSCIKFVNARPSIVAASCIAAVRHLSFIRPTWTPYLVQITECPVEEITPCMTAIIAIYNLHISKVQAMCYAAAKLSNNGGAICDSPESGFVSICDTKSESSDNESNIDVVEIDNCSLLLGKRSHSTTNLNENIVEEQNLCTNDEYSSLAKRRKKV